MALILTGLLFMGLFNRKNRKTNVVKAVSKLLPELLTSEESDKLKKNAAIDLEVKVTIREWNG